MAFSGSGKLAAAGAPERLSAADPPAPAPAPARRPPAPLGLLILISTVQPIAMNMYVPAMAAMQGDLATTAALIQLTLSAFLVATAVGQLVAGPLSDIYGRRLVLIAGLFVFCIGSLICVSAPSVEVLVIGRIIQGLGGCAGLVLSRAIIRDIHGTSNAASMIGYVTMGMAVAPLVTPALGGLIYEEASWRAIFVVMGAVGLIGLIATLVRLDETHGPTTAARGVFRRWRRDIGVLLALREFWMFAMTLASLCVAFFSFVAGGAFVAAFVFELSASTYGLFFIFVVSGYILGNFVTGRYSVRIGLTRMIVIGNLISLIGVLIALALGSLDVGVYGLFAPMFIVGIGNGFALPNCLAGCVSIRPDLAGTASGLAGAFQVGSGALASIAVGLLIDANWWPGTTWAVLLPMAAGASAAFALSLFLRRQWLA